MNQPSIGDILNAAPKHFCDNVNGGFNQETFLMALFSGQTTTVFAFTPSHMKKLSQWIAHQLKTYEAEHGTIKAEWDPNVPSPLRASDIKNPPEEEE